MKYGVIIIGLLLCLSGCASLQEAYIYDQEYGESVQSSLQQQIAYPDGQNGDATGGFAGITAEEVMDVYNGTFAEKPQKLNILKFGEQ